MTNCVNCGAPLKSGNYTCPYCGTTYTNNKVQAVFEQHDTIGEISIGGVSYKVYIAKVDFNNLVDLHRDYSGRLIRGNRITKRTFTLIEM